MSFLSVPVSLSSVSVSLSLLSFYSFCALQIMSNFYHMARHIGSEGMLQRLKSLDYSYIKAVKELLDATQVSTRPDIRAVACVQAGAATFRNLLL